jgi:hypothetical protein
MKRVEPLVCTFRLGSIFSSRVIYLCGVIALLLVFTLAPPCALAQRAKPKGVDAIPQPAVAAILAAFDKYEVVAMPAAHGIKYLDDVVFSLIRNPQFPGKVNDIEIECGNSLYQPVLDRYIAGEDVPFTEVRKAWRNTTQPMCGMSGFVEQFFPLVRAINQKLLPGKRLRVLAGDPPIDWDQVKNSQEFFKFADRERSIGSVMEKEVLSKHRKALLLAGTFHLWHGTRNAVSFYERDYPNVTFVIAELGVLTTDPAINSAIATWPIPSLAKARGTWLGALDISHFYPPPVRIDQECNVHTSFPENLRKPMEKLIDAFLYLGPGDLMLKEQMPADIALDVGYIKTLRARESLVMPGGERPNLEEFDQQIVSSAEQPLFSMPKAPDPTMTQHAVQDCLDRLKGRDSPPR